MAEPALSESLARIKATITDRIFKHSYYLARMAYQLKHAIYTAGKDPVVIFQMGKVGSTSILLSLEKATPDTPLYRVHTLSKQGLMEMEQAYFGDTPKLLRRSLLPETRHVYLGHFLHGVLKKGTSSRKWKFITLVRDPIARNVSEFFYSVDTTKHDPYLPDFYKQYHADEITPDFLLRRFVQVFALNSPGYLLPLNWFDDEFKPVLGIDVYSYEFPKSKGYQVIRKDHVEVLILKLEKLSSVVSEAIAEFLGLSDFTVVKANTARQKQYYPAYEQFMRHVNLAPSYVESMYSSKYMRHFYSEEEIAAFSTTWQKG